jgi:hypothetical protein
MGHALEIRCPSCGKQAKQHLGPKKPLVKESSWSYTPPIDSVRSPDHCYSRAHLRICQACGAFLTQELSSDSIDNLLTAFNDLIEKMKSLKSEVDELRAKNKRLQQAVDLSTKHLSPVATPKRTRPSTRPPHLKVV